MANIGAFGGKQMLDFVFNGAAAVAPASRFLALTYGTPNSTSAGAGMEHSSNLGYVRASVGMGAAGSPAGAASASNTATISFGPFSSSSAIQGAFYTDTVSIFSGNIWWFGTLLTARTVLPNDTLIINPGSLLVTLG